MSQVIERKNKDGTVSFTIRVSNGYKSDGTQIKPTTTFRTQKDWSKTKIKKELDRAVYEFEKVVREGTTVDGNINFEDYATQWLENKKIDLAPITYARYKNLLIRINKKLGNLKLVQLQPQHLKSFYLYLSKEKSKKTKTTLSKQTIKHYHRCISAILATAVKEQVISKNVASRDFIESPKVPKKEPVHLGSSEASKFVEMALQEEDIRKKCAFLIGIYGGVRNGELCGLEWTDVDFQNKTINIRRTSQYCAGEGVITKPPKNNSSFRTVIMPQIVFDVLEDYHKWYIKQEIANGDRWVRSNRLFVQENGKPIFPSTINNWLKKFSILNNLPHLTPHSLRHTFCTLLISKNVDIKTVSVIAGHSRTSTTLDYYSHFLKGAGEQASMVMDEILTPQ